MTRSKLASSRSESDFITNIFVLGQRFDSILWDTSQVEGLRRLSLLSTGSINPPTPGATGDLLIKNDE